MGATLIPPEAWPQLPNSIVESHLSKNPAMPQCHLGTKGLALEILGGKLKLQDLLWISFYILKKSVM